jgi:2-octaprenyl-6-methoxyphenol hydroxylase
MIVMADGGANLDKLPNIVIEEKDYGQSALLASVTTDKAHQHIAYERFTPNGPLALLPYRGEKDFALVWVAPHALIDDLMSKSDDDLKKAFQLQFGQRRRYPLKLRQTNARVSGRVAIIGNAAQAMHPVAGQGFNLGLRDAQTLANLVAQRNIDDALNQYDRLRQVDVASGVGITDLLAGAFLSDVSTLRVPRGVALALVDLLPVVRRRLANRMLFGIGRT